MRIRTGLVIALLASIVLAFPVAAQTAPPIKEAPYAPGLGEIMTLQQMRHMKLWFAGDARNWDLATYQLGELKEVFADVQDLLPRYQNIPVGEMIDAIMTGTITDQSGASVPNTTVPWDAQSAVQ